MGGSTNNLIAQGMNNMIMSSGGSGGWQTVTSTVGGTGGFISVDPGFASAGSSLGAVLQSVRFNSGREASPAAKDYAYREMQELKSSAVKLEVKEAKKVDDHLDMLKSLGFNRLSKTVSQFAERAMKENLAAVSGYTKILRAKFDEADVRIRNKSDHALQLSLTPVERYLGQNFEEGAVGGVSLPPMDVLKKMEAAKKEGLFDSFAIIHVAKVQDPILVGGIDGSQDMYFIAEWGDDISLSDLQ